MFEGWLTLAAWAQATERIRIGLMVGANPFREPTLTAKMATTLDHISGGRAILGIGAAWFEEEHEAFGIEFGSGPPERLRWLGEALPIMRGMLHGERPTSIGTALRGEGRTQRSSTDPAAHAPPCRWWWRAGHAQAGGSLRRCQQRRWRAGGRASQGSRAAPALRNRRTRPSRDRADDQHRDSRHPRLTRRGQTGPCRDVRAERERPTVDRPTGRNAGGRRGDAPPVPRDRLPPPRLRLPVALRRGNR